MIERIQETIVTLWQTDETRDRRPTVLDEVRQGLYYFENTLFDLVPDIYHELKTALREIYPGETFEIPVFLRYGSWMGGDRDGNPFVTLSMTEATLREQKSTALNLYTRRRRESLRSFEHGAHPCDLFAGIPREPAPRLRSGAAGRT